MSRSVLPSLRSRKISRPAFRPVLEALEDRLAPAVGVPTGFANVSIVDTGLASPAALETLPDGRVLVALQNGTIRVVQNDALLPAPLVNLSNVDSGGERGLLGMTYDPGFGVTSNYIYVYYTATPAANPALPFSHNRLSRLTVTGNTAGNEQVMWEFPNVGGAIWHMGGAVQFGPDGKIYVAIGDNQATTVAQSLANPFGKIHRFDVSGATAVIPADNPFYNATTGDNRAIWALGLRNPYTMAFQPGTGLFYINDVGQDGWEEIDEGQAGRNFGWPGTEGAFNPAGFPAYTNPIYAYPHAEGCAVTGGDFYNPGTTAFPAQYVGKYFFEDFCSGWMRTIDPTTKQVTTFATGLDFPTDMRVSNDGAIWYITRGAQTGGQPNTGGIGKIVYVASQTPTITGQPASQTVPVGEPVTFTVAAAGTAPLSYQWYRNGTAINGATAASYTIVAATAGDHGARFRAVVTNSHGSATSNEAVLSVTNNRRPTATITGPAPGTTYRGGDTIAFAGIGSDPDEGNLPGSRFTWQVDFHHDMHSHPYVGATTGITSGSFVIPTSGHPEGTFWYRIHLTVTDAQGLTHSVFRDINPQLSQVTLNTNVPGLQLKVGGQPKNLPYIVNDTINTDLTLEAPLVQDVGGATYQFVSWSDGGAATHTVRVPAVNTTYLATYRLSPTTYLSDLAPATTPLNGWGPMENDRSNGEQGAADGLTLTLNGIAYAKGLGVHAQSQLTYNLNGQFSTFLADIGIDDEVGDSGSVNFQVWADGAKLYESPLMTGSSATESVNVNVSGKNQLTLIVTDGGSANGVGFDHADWAGARLLAGTLPNRPPVIVEAAHAHQESASVFKVHVEASDPDNQPLTYTWSTLSKPTGAANPTFGVNGTGTASTTLATFSAAGTYVLRVTVSDGSSSVTGDVSLTVPAASPAIKINFQAGTSPGFAGYLADSGAAFGDRGNGLSYGWNGNNTATARDRNAANSPDERYDTLVHLQKPELPNAVWEIAVPNGAYRVRIVSGDPSHTDSVFRIAAEGVVTVNGTPTVANRWVEGTATVTVSDGRLTVANAAGASNNKINFIEITPAASASAVYVSDLPYTVIANGWGTVEKDRSNGETGPADGRTITLNGVTYAKGLGVHAASEVSIALNGAYSRFQSDIGVDDEVGANGTVVFQVWADGALLYDSGAMTGNSLTRSVDIDVSGKNRLKLIVTDGGNGNGFDHADWANARLTQ